MRQNDNETPLILPLMMFGESNGQYHEKGKPVKHKIFSHYDVYKSGKKKGQRKKVYKWETKLVKRRVITGYDGVYKRGKHKGEPKPVYESKMVTVPSTGFFPSVNHMYMTLGRGGQRRPKQLATDKLNEWKELASRWVDQTGFKQAHDEKIAVDLVYYIPSGRKDTHNTKKLLLDALEGVFVNDDYYICDRTLNFYVDDENPRVEIVNVERMGG